MDPSAHNHFERQINGSACPFLSRASSDGDGFFARARRAVLEAAARLDALPRDDAFWHNTNGRLTWTKLHDFTNYLRKRNPADRAALWCRIALDQMSASGYLRTAEWRRLRHAGDWDVRWPIHSAYTIAAAQGEFASYRACLSRDLAQLLREEPCSAEVEAALLALPSEIESLPLLATGSLPAIDWSVRVLHGLQDPRLWDGLSELDRLCDAFGQRIVPLSGVPEHRLARLAAGMGFSDARPGAIWGATHDQSLLAYLEQKVYPTADLHLDEEEWRVVQMLGGLGYGTLLGLKESSALDADGFHLAEAYLDSLLAFGLGGVGSEHPPPNTPSG